MSILWNLMQGHYLCDYDKPANKIGPKWLWNAYLWDLNDIEQEHKNMSFMVQMHSPCNKCLVIWGGPCICSKMDLAWMLLKQDEKRSETRQPTYLQDLINTLAASLKCSLNIAWNSHLAGAMLMRTELEWEWPSSLVMSMQCVTFGIIHQKTCI